ncbi:NACHT domain-containing protein [Aphanothece sacrum]|uniref:Two-component sensor histidine kinase n=1 Tax=Aphanothece sacrum FPU1 TaxID=1920663 RepID=A0A401IJM5_APHSA|nr:NACHT domain-containing NTPase [Aphanothece sacrum]GBF81416.1 two-component sensor histidine kinase [Aphanothece sacrum FPU1]GBF85393.1 two-component sensor histidine kinase [Aphanothece sacrum FPU3]
MTHRSVRSSEDGITQAKQILAMKGWSQQYLAGEVGLSSRQCVWKFLTGRPIERHIFKEICFKLELNWEEIVDLPYEQSPKRVQPEWIVENLGLEECVKMMRAKVGEQIQIQCNSLQSSFELTQPPLDQIYTTVKILPEPTHQRWLEVVDLQQGKNSTQRFSVKGTNPKAVSGLEIINKYNKLMILGKPGAGKTTFLQYIALQCSKGKYKGDLIPCFIQLRSWLEQGFDEEINLSSYLMRQCLGHGLSHEQSLTLLQEGKFFCLLDGLDEISQESREILYRNIDNFAQDYYKNRIIMTCRGAVQQFHFKGFTYVEIADFDHTSIENFAQRWFVAMADNKRNGKNKADEFLEQLDLPENQPIRELAITPILLNLLCSVFKERSSFPTKRAKLYQIGLDILLQRWDQARGIERDGIYHNLPLPHKIKLLCQIAAITFERDSCFFESREVLDIIEEYLENSLDLKEDAETLWLTSEAVLKSIELQHGLLIERARDIYSFSHLTFQEYLTARKIVSTKSEVLKNELNKLAQKILESRWREVILLTISLLPNADFVLQNMKQVLDSLVQQDLLLERFLVLLENKVSSVKFSGEKSALRAFYFTLFRHRDLDLALALDINLSSQLKLDKELQLDSILARAFVDSVRLVEKPNLKHFLNLCFTLELENKFQLDPNFQESFQTLKSILPSPENKKEDIFTWWQEEGKEWVETFHHLLIEHRQIGYNWQLNPEQQELWDQYYQANLFLVECLNSDGQISPKVSQEIESTLLLPPQILEILKTQINPLLSV